MLKKIKFFFQPAFYDKSSLFFIVFRSIQFGIGGSIVALSIQHIIDAISISQYSIVWNWLIVLSCYYLLQDLLGYFFRNIYNKWYYWLKIFFYQKYMPLYFTADNNIVEWFGTGKTQSIIFWWCNSWQNNLVWLIQQWLKMCVWIILWFILIWKNLWLKWFLVVLIIFIVSYIFVQYGNKILSSLRKERRDSAIEWDKHFIRMIMSKSEILQNNKITTEKKFIKSHYDNIYKLRLRESRKQVLTFDLQKLTFTIIRISILIYVVFQIKAWIYTIGTLSLFWLLVNQIYGNILDLNELIIWFHQDKINTEKLREYFENTPQIIWYNTGREFIPNNTSILLQNITYDYGKGEILRNFSLNIIWWKKTALIGMSWSGKSTLIKLIAWYLYTTDGAILVDGQPLPNKNNLDEAISLESYYKHIWYLTQEPSVFDWTIGENLLYGSSKKDVSQEEVMAALNLAQCQFVFDFKDGLDTEIWEKGIRLSWWQRQRLAIAKIILKDPKIVLLDEPTSALDSFSEEEVTKAFDALFEWRTVIVIAHRLQTVKKADDIIVLDQWQVIERWTHDQLVSQWWQYAKMLELQSGF